MATDSPQGTIVDEDPTIEPIGDIRAQLQAMVEAYGAIPEDNQGIAGEGLEGNGNVDEDQGTGAGQNDAGGGVEVPQKYRRRAVWFSRRNFIEHYRLALEFPKDQLLTNFDGLGGVLVARSKEDAEEFRQQKIAGVPVRAIIGMAIGAGTGKPDNNTPARIVQLRSRYGAVIRETAVPAHEAAQVAYAWGPRAVILSIDETLARRQTLHNLHTLQ